MLFNNVHVQTTMKVAWLMTVKQEQVGLSILYKLIFEIISFI